LSLQAAASNKMIPISLSSHQFEQKEINRREYECVFACAIVWLCLGYGKAMARRWQGHQDPRNQGAHPTPSDPQLKIDAVRQIKKNDRTDVHPILPRHDSSLSV